jgi:hypothetical protein
VRYIIGVSEKHRAHFHINGENPMGRIADQLRATLEEMKAADERMQSMLDSYVEETGKALEALKADFEGES